MNLPTVCSLGWLTKESVSVPESARRRPYATLLAKGEDRKQRILAVAERLLARNGWRNTSLAQIAKEAGVSPPGCCTTSSPRNSCSTRCWTPATPTTTRTPTAPGT